MTRSVRGERTALLAGLALALAAAPAAGTEAAPPREAVVEVGVHAGVAARPSKRDDVTYSAGPALGGYARLVYLPWLGVRLSAQREWATASHEPGALGAPGTSFSDQDLTRIVLGAALEPSVSPLPRLDVFAGLGVGWGRTTATSLTPSGGETSPSLPGRSAVFVEFPVSTGVRYAIVADRLVASASGSVSWLSNQSGELLQTEETPGADGSLVAVRGLSEIGTSWTVLAGLALVL